VWIKVADFEQQGFELLVVAFKEVEGRGARG
jgi:hypothetical protein